MKKTLLMLLAVLSALLFTACAQKTDAPAAADAIPTIGTVAAADTPAAPVATVDISGLAMAGDASQYVNALPTPDPFKREVYDGPPSMLDPSAAAYNAVKNFEIAEVPQQDLSRMSATMAYAQLYNIFLEQENHVGQTMRLRGQYVPMRDEGNQAKYHFIMVYDNAACCQLGLEFLWTNPTAYPADYSLIELTGVFDICNDGGEKFCVLRVKDLTVLQEAPAATEESKEAAGVPSLSEVGASDVNFSVSIKRPDSPCRA